MCKDEITFRLNSPITEEQWDAITDVDFEHTDRIWFSTKHGKEVEFVKRKNGKWLPDNNYYYEERFICSVCGKSYKVDTCMGKPMWEFCPCGADMRGEHDE